MEFIVLGFVTAANLIFILYKFKLERFSDALLDLILLIAVAAVFMGSYGGLVIGTIASLLVSIYLYFNRPTLPEISKPKADELENFFEEFKRRAKRRQ